MPTVAVDQRDALDWLRDQGDESVALMITDPPYESLEKHRSVGTTTRLRQSKASSNPWFHIFPNSRFEDFFREAWRVLAWDSHFYLFCDAETMFVVKPLAEAAGFRFWKPIIWDKVKIGMGYHYRARCERILFFEKGKRRLRNLGIADILSVPRVNRGYPTEKPVELMRILITQSSELGELVVDPFMGSGSVAVAALSSGRRFSGNDISPEAVELTLARIAALDGGVTYRSLLEQRGSYMVTRSTLSEPTSWLGAEPVATPPHRGRIQAQGDDLPSDPSRAWNATEPPLKTDGLSMVDSLEEELPRAARQMRQTQFAKARHRIRTAPPEGLNAPVSLSFSVHSPPTKARRARVDIEVRAGRAFVDEP